MATILRFEDIEAWQLGRELKRLVYGCSKKGEFAKDFALKDQIRRAAISITANIAEGFEREGNREFVQFLRRILHTVLARPGRFSLAPGFSRVCEPKRTAAASAACATECGKPLKRFPKPQASNTRLKPGANERITMGTKIGAFMNYLQRTEIRGRKFLKPAGA